MFERYEEQARRIVFYSRYEASKLGSPYIETEHLLMGMIREARPLLEGFMTAETIDDIERQIASRPHGEPGKTSVDLPLSHESKRVLAYGAEEQERMRHTKIAPGHLLLGLLREEHGFAAQILRRSGVDLKTVRERMRASDPGGS